MHDFLDLEPTGDGRWWGTVPASMAQGRAAFGGLLVGFGARASLALVGPDRPLRSVCADFVAPVGPGVVGVEARVLRAGRALTHTEVRVTQDGGLALVALFASALGRPTGLAAPLPTAPAAAADDLDLTLPYIEGVTPAFTQHYDFRWVHGGLPFSGATASGFGGFIRPKAPVPVDAATVLTLLDAWPCPVLARADRVVPASSVTWLVNFVRAVPAAPASAWWRFESEAVASAEGCVDADSRLWGPDGLLVATSRQMMVEFSA